MEEPVYKLRQDDVTQTPRMWEVLRIKEDVIDYPHVFRGTILECEAFLRLMESNKLI